MSVQLWELSVCQKPETTGDRRTPFALPRAVSLAKTVSEMPSIGVKYNNQLSVRVQHT